MDDILRLLDGRAQDKRSGIPITRGVRSVGQKDSTSEDVLRLEVERLQAENERLRKQGTAVRLQVSQKGGVSVYGLGRYPVTLYKEQWLKLLARADEIRAFITEHDAQLSSKTNRGRETDGE